MLRLLVLLAFLIFIPFGYSQSVFWGIGGNFSGKSHTVSYEKNDGWGSGIIDSVQTRNFVFGPSVRVWYEINNERSIKFVYGFEAIGGVIMDLNTYMGGFHFETPVYVGAKYLINDTYSVYSTVGGSYNSVIDDYDEYKYIGFTYEAAMMNSSKSNLLLKFKLTSLISPIGYSYLGVKKSEQINPKAFSLGLSFYYIFD